MCTKVVIRILWHVHFLRIVPVVSSCLAKFWRTYVLSTTQHVVTSKKLILRQCHQLQLLMRCRHPYTSKLDVVIHDSIITCANKYYGGRLCVQTLCGVLHHDTVSAIWVFKTRHGFQSCTNDQCRGLIEASKLFCSRFLLFSYMHMERVTQLCLFGYLRSTKQAM